MLSRFDDTQILDTDVILTTKASDQMRILLSQLVNSKNFSEANFNMNNSAYFMKHYDISMQQPYRVGVGRETAQDLADSIDQNLREDHFDYTGPARNVIASARHPDQVLRPEDVDEEMFIFPDRNNNTTHEQVPITEADANGLSSTTDLIAQVNARQQSKAQLK